MRLSFRLSFKEAKEIELGEDLKEFISTRHNLRQFLWDAAAEGHNTNKGYAHKNCDACNMAKEIREVLGG